ncbi:SBBP repeat-containing protein, partial [Candidatus Magnetominusculus dajiuhuensis]|uniref:SBBP repeat-containing protein n=1 Tax=Candidatus Magnetominusculus dajiuhuensis TaxID=3137712 RepID=UPI003B435A2C
WKSLQLPMRTCFIRQNKFAVGARRLSVDKDGSLVIASKFGKMLMHKPLVYQEIDGVKKEINGKYRVTKGNLVSFNVAGYDKTKALVIDPSLAYSTYLGGSSTGGLGETGYGIQVDTAGNAYIAGITSATDFPVTTGAFQTTIKYKGSFSVFVTKLNSTGTALLYSTYLGGSGGEAGIGIAIDPSGNAYVTGSTHSSDFPVTSDAYQNKMKGTLQNAFVTELNPYGSALVYSTYLGGSGNTVYAFGDTPYAIAFDSYYNAYVTGATSSSDFPITTGVFQKTLKGTRNAFISKLQLQSTSTYRLTVTKSGTGTGTITSSPYGIDCGATCYGLYTPNSWVTLIATPDSGSSFTSWSGCDSTQGIYCGVTMSAAKNVNAVFTLSSYTLTITNTGTGSGTVASFPAGLSCSGNTCTGLFSPGTVVALFPTEDTNSQIAYWPDTSHCSNITSDITSDLCSVTMSSNMSLAINFKRDNDTASEVLYRVINDLNNSHNNGYGPPMGLTTGSDSGGLYYTVQTYCGTDCRYSFLAYSDGKVYNNILTGRWDYMSDWKASAMARKWINAVYTQNATEYGAKFEDVVWTRYLQSSVQYVQWLVGGSFIMAGDDGEMYYWNGSSLQALGIPWVQ